LATAVRIAALLLSRSLCEGAWPVLQALSLCALPFGALKQLVRGTGFRGFEIRLNSFPGGSIGKRFFNV
jgi:hypothetical protein